MATSLGLDCGAVAAQRGALGDRFVIVTWTGARLAFVVLADDQPTPPFEPQATVTVLTEDLDGEFIDDDQELFGARLSEGATILIGHDDYNLGATAKSWQAVVTPPPDAEATIDAERHGIEVLRAAGARNVSVAQPPEFGSEEGFLQFVSPRGLIGVADVAPADWFDPMVPRYLDGVTTVRTVGGVDLRITEPGPEAPPWVGAVEIGFGCGDWSWILEPPGNGSATELIEFAADLVAGAAC